MTPLAWKKKHDDVYTQMRESRSWVRSIIFFLSEEGGGGRGGGGPRPIFGKFKEFNFSREI